MDYHAFTLKLVTLSTVVQRICKNIIIQCAKTHVKSGRDETTVVGSSPPILHEVLLQSIDSLRVEVVSRRIARLGLQCRCYA